MRTLAFALIISWGAAAAAAPDLPLDPTKHGLVYRVRGSESVKLRRDVVLAGAPRFDLYTPAAPRPSKLPVVVFVNGVGDPPANKLKDWRIYQDWARAVAARGYAAVLHETDAAQPARDIARLLERLHADGASLGLDVDRVVLWACSANVQHALPIAMDGAPAGVRALVIYYGIGTPNRLRKDLPVLWVLAGLDGDGLIRGQRALWARAVAEGVPWTMVNAPTLPHAFDAFDASPESRRIVGDTLAFFDDQLGAPPAAPPPSQSRDILADLYGHRHAAAIAKLEPLAAARPRDYDVLSTLAWAYRGAGQRPKVIALYRRLLELQPGDPRAARSLTIEAAQAGDCAAAAAGIAVLDGKAFDPQFLVAKATCDRLAGRTADAQRALDAAVAAGANAGNTYYNLACALALAGKRDDALATLEQAVARGWTDAAHMAADTDLVSLRGEPRFKALAAKLVVPRAAAKP
jgi:hypothetical protein